MAGVVLPQVVQGPLEQSQTAMHGAWIVAEVAVRKRGVSAGDNQIQPNIILWLYNISMTRCPVKDILHLDWCHMQ